MKIDNAKIIRTIEIHYYLTEESYSYIPEKYYDLESGVKFTTNLKFILNIKFENQLNLS